MQGPQHKETPPMQKAKDVLDRYYLETRCALVELAATLDRLDRAPDAGGPEVADDPRIRHVYEALAILAEREAEPNRAERLLNLFSDPA
jgi:hypothetical protein